MTPSQATNIKEMIWNSGGVFEDNSNVDDLSSILPTLYLKSNVKVISGDGTKDKPYNLTY